MECFPHPTLRAGYPTCTQQGHDIFSGDGSNLGLYIDIIFAGSHACGSSSRESFHRNLEPSRDRFDFPKPYKFFLHADRCEQLSPLGIPRARLCMSPTPPDAPRGTSSEAPSARRAHEKERAIEKNVTHPAGIFVIPSFGTKEKEKPPAGWLPRNFFYPNAKLFNLF